MGLLKLAYQAHNDFHYVKKTMKTSICIYNCGSGIVIYEKNHFRSVELNDAIVEFQCDHFSWDTLKLSDVITLQGKTYYVTAL